MEKINYISSFEELVNNTPLYHPKRWLQKKGFPEAKLFVKLESFNPSGSVKDRAALGMILDLEERGLLKGGGTIIEPTSGNTGIGAAAIAAARGYRAIFTLPDSMTVERRNAARAIRKHKDAREVSAVEPDTSPVLSGGPAGKHGIQGIGAGFIPEILDLEQVDKVLQVKQAAAGEATRDFAQSEGRLLGISSGAALAACFDLLQDRENAGKTNVTVLPDSGERYL